MPKRTSSNSKPSVAIIGAGRLGQALALALNSAGYPIKALVARRRSRAEKAAASLGRRRSEAVALGASELRNLPATELILISTPDDAIEDTASRLAAALANTGTEGVPPEMIAKREKFSPRQIVVLHTSGALSSQVLGSLAKIGIPTGSLHPLTSVSDPHAGAKALRGAYWCVEGDRLAAKAAQQIVRDLKGKSFSIAAENKALYHVAALTAAGQLTALVDLAIEILGSCGLSRKRAQEVLMPLIESAVNNLKEAPPEKVLTGTFARGDLATVRRHLRALADKGDALDLYKILGLRSLHLARNKRLDPKAIKEIRKLLNP